MTGVTQAIIIMTTYLNAMPCLNLFGMSKCRPRKKFDQSRFWLCSIEYKCSIIERSIVFDWQNVLVSSIMFDYRTQSKSFERWHGFDCRTFNWLCQVKGYPQLPWNFVGVFTILKKLFPGKIFSKHLIPINEFVNITIKTKLCWYLKWH